MGMNAPKPYPHQIVGAKFLASEDRACLFDDMGLGKQNPVDTKVMTPNGWRQIGTLRVGDLVTGSNGESTRITGVFPQGIKASYRVTFSDASCVEAGAEHLWTVLYRRGGKQWAEMLLTTETLRTRPRIEGLSLAGVRLYIPMLSGPVRMEAPVPPIDPYLMGQLIGNGSLGNGSCRLSTNAFDWNEVFDYLPADLIGSVRQYGPVVQCGIKGIRGIIRELGLDVLSRDKFIPAVYLYNDADARHFLLQGLMDTDGSVSESHNRLTYHTTSKRLADDVVELVEMLGGIASVREYDRTHDLKPTDYQVRMRLPSWAPPFRVSRKASRYKPGTHAHPMRTVRSVEYVRDVESVCITVEAPDELYVTEHCILTHNTVQALLALESNPRVLVVCPAVVKSVWESESRVWRPDLLPVVLSGRGSFRWPEPGEIVITNYDVLPMSAGEPPSHVYLIPDEAHYVKSYAALRTKRLRKLSYAVLAKSGHVWPMTGTPLMNEPPDLWNVLAAARLENDVFGHWSRFMLAFGAYQDEIYAKGSPPRKIKVTRYRQAAPWVAGALQKVSLRRRKVDVLCDLPPKVRRTIRVDCLTPDARKACDEALRSVAGLGTDLDAAVEAAIDRGVAFETMARARAGLALLKATAVGELLDLYRDAGQPVVVLAAHRAPIEILSHRPGWRAILGGTPLEERATAVGLFQAGKLEGIAATIGAAGTGITLTAAADAIFVDLDWSPAANAQAEDRCHRIGQTRGVTITVLEADHELDQAVNRVLTRKAGIIASAGIG